MIAKTKQIKPKIIYNIHYSCLLFLDCLMTLKAQYATRKIIHRGYETTTMTKNLSEKEDIKYKTPQR